MNRSLQRVLGGGLLAVVAMAPIAVSQPSPDDASESARSNVQANALILAQVDQRLARALAAIDAAPDQATAETLRDIRKQANTIVFRITQVLDDGFPCQATPLPPLRATGARLPDPDGYVPFDVAPELVSMVSAKYPDSARNANAEGTVLVRVLVGTDGLVEGTRVVQSVQGLDGAAVATVRTAVFKPALSKNEPVAVWMVIPIEFVLSNRK